MRDGNPVEYMYTKMPNLDVWAKYEQSKDNFIDEQYDMLLKKAQKKKEKELKELGYVPIEKKPLTEIQQRTMNLLVEYGPAKTAEMLGITPQAVSQNKIFALKKGYTLNDFKKEANADPMGSF